MLGEFFFFPLTHFSVSISCEQSGDSPFADLCPLYLPELINIPHTKCVTFTIANMKIPIQTAFPTVSYNVLVPLAFPPPSLSLSHLS